MSYQVIKSHELKDGIAGLITVRYTDDSTGQSFDISLTYHPGRDSGTIATDMAKFFASNLAFFAIQHAVVQRFKPFVKIAGNISTITDLDGLVKKYANSKVEEGYYDDLHDGREPIIKGSIKM